MVQGPWTIVIVYVERKKLHLTSNDSQSASVVGNLTDAARQKWACMSLAGSVGIVCVVVDVNVCIYIYIINIIIHYYFVKTFNWWLCWYHCHD